jgi:very-short-patch-repair endonuclease
LADSVSFIRAKAFRRLMTPPEARLWSCLRGSRFRNLKFRRQHPIGPYILDFYCAAARLAVEVDGAVHDSPEQGRHDQRRTAWLADRGVKVVRLRAEDVRTELEGVLNFIGQTVRSRLRDHPLESPPPGR